MNRLGILLAVVMVIFCLEDSVAQSVTDEHPAIGKSCPSIVFNEMHYFPTPTATISDFKDKWIVLDFWDSHCAACLESFPKTSDLQKKFRDQVKFILVGESDNKWNKNIREVYEKYRVRENLDLSIAYDSLLWDRFDIPADPYIIIIDPSGIVRVVTSVIDETNLQRLLRNEIYHFIPVVDGDQQVKKRNRMIMFEPYLLHGNAAADTCFFHRSILAKWDIDSMVPVDTHIINYVEQSPGLYQIAGASIRSLYNLAYIGESYLSPGDSLYNEYSMFPELHIRSTDTAAVFDWGDPAQNIGAFIYSTSFPANKASVAYIRNLMKGDLKNYFGYDVKTETRDVPIWNLVPIQPLIFKHKTKGGEVDHFIKASRSEIVATNITTKKILAIVEMYFQPLSKNDPLFFDETNLGYNLDINLDAALSDFNDLLKALRKNGLDLQKAERKMKVLIISDQN